MVMMGIKDEKIEIIAITCNHEKIKESYSFRFCYMVQTTII